MTDNKYRGLAILVLLTSLVVADWVGIWHRYSLGQRLDVIETHHAMDAANEWRRSQTGTGITNRGAKR